MTDIIYDFITQGIDMMVVAAILASVVIMLRGTTIISQISADSAATSDRMNYYRQYNEYDNKDVNGATVISALVRFRDTLQLEVAYSESGVQKYIRNDANTGKFYFQIENGTPVEIKVENLSSYISSKDSYTAQLYEDGNITASEHFTGGYIYKIGFKMN